MGSKGGWMDIFTMGSYSAQRNMARAQASAAERYAKAQEAQAKAIASSSAAQPGTVQASTASTQEAASRNVYNAQKRKKSTASTVNQRFRGLGSGGGKQNLGDA
ncbi:MAG: hypothetical protein IIV41_10325 [Akkermansia sp.]|nr:hypothetical protein [Akkermansia sp.]